jgi:hypothetical protein
MSPAFSRGALLSLGGRAGWSFRGGFLSRGSLRRRSSRALRGLSAAFLCSSATFSTFRGCRRRFRNAFSCCDSFCIVRGLCRVRWRRGWCRDDGTRDYSDIEKVEWRRAFRSAAKAGATRAHSARRRHTRFRRWRIRCRGSLELTLNRRCSRCRRDFVVASALSQIDYIGIMCIMKNAEEIALAQTFAVAAEK